MKRRAFIGAAGGLVLGVATNLALNKIAEGRYEGTEENLDKILERAGGDDLYVLLGEDHRDDTLHSRVLMPLIESGCFSSIYMEALKRGDYRREGDALRNETIIKWNPEKYDRIIETSLSKGLDVHGIDAHDKRAVDEVREWAEYIIKSKKDGSCLVLTGRGHVNFWRKTYIDDAPGEKLPTCMKDEDVKQGKIITVTTLHTEYISPGLYRIYDLPEIGGVGTNNIARVLKQKRAADFVWCMG